MNEIVQITQAKIGTENTNSVNARELHEVLKVKKDFSDWIKQQLMIGRKNSVYVEGIDYLKNHLKGVRSIEYVLSLDTAKRISMLSKTKKGDEVRKYFIETEKQSKQIALPKNALKEIKLALQGVVELDERLDTHNDRLIDLENNVRLTNQQEYELTQVHHKKVYELARLYGEDQNDKKLISKLHRQVWKLFKNHFMLPRFNELQANKFNDGIAFLNGVKLKDI